MAEANASGAQPTGSREPQNAPTEETVAATDELFQQEVPVIPEPVAGDEAATSADTDEDLAPPSEASHDASVGADYVRELQLEFEEQEEEGKL